MLLVAEERECDGVVLPRLVISMGGGAVIGGLIVRFGVVVRAPEMNVVHVWSDG
jgi:hypothetical protein